MIRPGIRRADTGECDNMLCFEKQPTSEPGTLNHRRERYPRDDLNVRHTAPEAVALSGLSYGGTAEVEDICTIPTSVGISNHQINR